VKQAPQYDRGGTSTLRQSGQSLPMIRSLFDISSKNRRYS
jgi:hypothetical protein